MIVCATLAVLAAIVLPEILATHTTIDRTRTILVEPRDSLWTIARDNAVPGHSTAETVTLIKELNGLSSSLVNAGQLLRVPADNDSAVAEAAR